MRPGISVAATQCRLYEEGSTDHEMPGLAGNPAPAYVALSREFCLIRLLQKFRFPPITCNINPFLCPGHRHIQQTLF